MASTQRSNIEVFFRVLGSERVRKAFQDLGRAGTDVAGKLGGVGTGIASALADAGRRALELSKTLALVGAAGLGALAKGIKDTTDSSAELTSIVLALRAINGEVGKANGQPLFKPSASGGLQDVNSGGATKSADDLNYLNGVADRSGKSIKNLSRQYVGLQASATKLGVPLGDVRTLFSGISDAATVLGVDADATDRAFVALNQIASKGVVSAEELRGQLAEAIPGAIPLAAKAYGMPVKQFMASVAAGQVDSATFISKFGKALNDEYAASATAAAKTTRVAMGRLANSLFLAKVAIGSGELDNALRRIVDTATRLIKTLTANGAFTRFGAHLAEALKPIADRFDAAVDGGYDFERVLNFLAATARVLVDIFLGVVGAIARVSDGIGNLKRVFDSYGLRLPSIGDSLIAVASAFEKVTAAIAVRQFTGNGFLDFFVGLFVLVEACVFAVARLVAPKVGPGVNSLEQAFGRIAYYLNQAAAAITTLSTGQVSPVLDETGEGILVKLIQAIDKIRQFIKLVKEALALLSGKAAPQGSSLDTQKTFAKRDALGDLVSGRENQAKFNDQGEQLYDPKQFETLFKLRDIITNIINFIYDNRGALGAVFDGASDALKGVTSALDELSKLLDPIAKALGFENLGVAIGYAAGFLFIFKRVAGVIAIVRTAILSMTGGIASFAATLGLTTPQLLVIGAILAGIVFIVAKIASNWRLLKDEIGNIVTLIGAGLAAGLAKIIRGMAGLLSYIPLVGGKIERSLNGFADKLDEGVAAARKNVVDTSVERTSQRQVENGGRDPYSDAGPNGFGAFDFLKDSGFAKMFGDLGTKQDETNQTLKDIAAQNAAANDNSAALEQQLKEATAGAGAPPQADFSRPVIIYLSDGTPLELRGREADAARFNDLAAKTARNRAGPSPAWTGG